MSFASDFTPSRVAEVALCEPIHLVHCTALLCNVSSGAVLVVMFCGVCKADL